MAATTFKIAAQNGDDLEIRYYSVTAGQTFVRGDLVYLTSNKISICGSDPSLILGIAMADAAACLATTTNIHGSDRCPVQIIDSAHDYFIGCTSSPSNSNVGTAYGIANASNGNWQVDFTDTTNKRVTVTGFSLSTSPGQEGAFVRFSSTYCQASAVTL